jgi:nucleoside-diphosphate-sugar epimerase
VKVAVAGAQTAVGRCAVPGLQAGGHDVVDLGRSVAALLDVDAMTEAMRGCDALVNVSAQLPVGAAARWKRSWRTHDLLRSDGVRSLVTAARAAGVRRVVQQSVSFVYADHGEEWVTERSPLCVTAATEPASVGEHVVQDFASPCRTGVVLRMGLVLGNSGLTRWSLQAAAHGRPVGLGDPGGFAHVIHSDDVAAAVEAALTAPSGVFNVGAEPVRRQQLVDAYAAAVGQDRGGFVRSWLGGRRLEPLARSLRVSSTCFNRETGWAPRRPEFDLSWLTASEPAPAGTL